MQNQQGELLHRVISIFTLAVMGPNLYSKLYLQNDKNQHNQIT
jgi:hypothetical protein